MGKMIKYRESFIKRIKRVLEELFGKKHKKISEKNNLNNERIDNIEKINFKQSIEIKIDEENMRIMQLQKKYKLGIIKAQDMNDKECEELLKLFEKQNRELRKKIEEKKEYIKRKQVCSGG